MCLEIVEKNSLVSQLIYKKLPATYPVDHDYPTYFLTVDGKEAKLEFFVQESMEFKAFRDKIYGDCDGFVAVYPIDDQQLYYFKKVESQCMNLIETRNELGKNTPLVICGNRCDLEEQRIVSQAEGLDLAQRTGAEFFETSAKMNINIEEAFSTVVRLIRKDSKKRKEKKKEKEVCITY